MHINTKLITKSDLRLDQSSYSALTWQQVNKFIFFIIVFLEQKASVFFKDEDFQSIFKRNYDICVDRSNMGDFVDIFYPVNHKSGDFS